MEGDNQGAEERSRMIVGRDAGVVGESREEVMRVKRRSISRRVLDSSAGDLVEVEVEVLFVVLDGGRASRRCGVVCSRRRGPG